MRGKSWILFPILALTAALAAFACGEYFASLPVPWGAGAYFGTAMLLTCLGSFAGMLFLAPAWRKITRGVMARWFIPFVAGVCVLAIGFECLYAGLIRLPRISVSRSYPVSFCIDVSGSNSLTDPSLQRKTALISQLRASGEDTSAAITVFDDAPRLLFPMTRLTASAVDEAVSLLEGASYSGGGTDISSALRFAVEQLGGEQGLVVLYTDGEDSGVLSEKSALQTLLKQNGATLSVIQLAPEGSESNYSSTAESQALQTLASQSGGQYVLISDVDTLSLTIGGVVETARQAAGSLSLLGPRSDEDAAHIVIRCLAMLVLALVMALCCVVMTNHKKVVLPLLAAGVLAGAIAACATELLPFLVWDWRWIRLVLCLGLTLPVGFAQGICVRGLDGRI